MQIRFFALPVLAIFALAGCSGDDTNGASADGGGGADASHADASSGGDSGGGDSSASDSGGGDSSSSNDSGGGTDAADGGADAADADAGPAIVNNCTTFEDHTAAGDARAIAFGGANGLAYVPSCMEIKAGQIVTWNGDFSLHPLAAFNGDANSPIQSTSTGTTVQFTFANAGTFGFHCQVHAQMIGAVKVVP